MYGTKQALKFYHDNKCLLLFSLYVCSKIMYCVCGAVALYERTETFFFFSRIWISSITCKDLLPASYTHLFLSVIAFKSGNLLWLLGTSMIPGMERTKGD